MVSPLLSSLAFTNGPHFAISNVSPHITKNMRFSVQIDVSIDKPEIVVLYCNMQSNMIDFGRLNDCKFKLGYHRIEKMNFSDTFW